MERDRQRAGERAAGEGGAGPALEGAAISLAAAEAQIDNGSGAVTGIESLNLAIGDDTSRRRRPLRSYGAARFAP